MKKTILFSLLMSLLTFVFTGCSSLFYYPHKKEYYKPEQLPLKYENIFFENEENVKIHAWWFPSETKPAKGTFVFFHGNAENISTHFLNLSWLPKNGYNYFIFDYPGFGESSGEPSPKSTVSAGKAAVRWVHQNKDPGPLVIYGQSLGGAVALRTFEDTKNEIPYKALIADSTFSSYKRVARNKLSYSWLLWILQPMTYLVLSDRYAIDDLKSISPTPLLVIHGAKDNVVEPENGQYIYDHASEPKEIWRIPDGFHGSTFWKHDFAYRTKVLEWLSKLPPRP